MTSASALMAPVGRPPTVMQARWDAPAALAPSKYRGQAPYPGLLRSRPETAKPLTPVQFRAWPPTLSDAQPLARQPNVNRTPLAGPEKRMCEPQKSFAAASTITMCGRWRICPTTISSGSLAWVPWGQTF